MHPGARELPRRLHLSGLASRHRALSDPTVPAARARARRRRLRSGADDDQPGDPVGLADPSTFGKEVVGTIIEDCAITHCSRVGGYFRGDNLVIRNCLVSDTSTEGIYVIGSSDCLLERNIIARNNVEELTGYYPSAVKIFNQTRRVVCRDNLIVDNPHSNGLPFRGPGGAGLTVIYWVKTRAQTGYYVNWWWGPGDGSFYFDADDVPYVGGHLYPTSGDNNGTSHEYEIAIRGGDFRATLAGTNHAAVHGVWRKQAIRLTVNGDDTVTVRYYLNLPSVANADIIERTEPATYGTSQRVGVASAFIFGDSPWYLNYQHECLSGSLRAAKIMAADIGQSDMLAEAADMNQMATAAGY